MSGHTSWREVRLVELVNRGWYTEAIEEAMYNYGLSLADAATVIESLRQTSQDDRLGRLRELTEEM